MTYLEERPTPRSGDDSREWEEPPLQRPDPRPMFETTTVISRVRRGHALFWCLLPTSLAAHLSAFVGIMALKAWSVSFPSGPPPVVEPYRVLMMVPLPPPPPPKPPAMRTARAEPPAKPPEIVAPIAIPDEVPELLPIRPASALIRAAGGVTGGVSTGEPGGVRGGTAGGVAPIEPPLPPNTIRVPRSERLPLRGVRRRFPDYPRKWQRLGVEDSLVIRYRIDRRGRVVDAFVLEPPEHQEFADESLKAILSWRFSPHMVDGEPMEVVHEVGVNFRIERRGR